MASKRIATSFLLRSARYTPKPRLQPIQSIIQKTHPRVSLGIQCVQKRWSSETADGNKNYDFQDVVEMIQNPSEDRVLIDAREPSELKETGRIPGAINIPVSSSPDAFFMKDEEFVDQFGFERPGKDKELIFYCKAGVRSRTAAELARIRGWTKVGEYKGSWLDWERNRGKVEK